MAETAAARRTGLAFLAALAIAWGCNMPMIKIVALEVPVWQFRAVTGLVAGGATLALARLFGEKLGVPRRCWAALGAAALFNMTSWYVLATYGVLLIGSGHTAILGYTMPLFQAALAAYFLGERFGARHATALALGALAVLVLASQDFTALGASPLGLALVLVGAANWAIGTTIQKRVAWPMGPLTLVGWQVVLGTLPMVPVALVLEDFVYHRASLAAFAASAYLAFVAQILAYYLWFRILEILPSNVASVGVLMVPVIGALSSAWLLGEPFGWREAAALAAVVGAVYLVLVRAERAAGPGAAC
jgi:drug/metabolite transporter (DMT)-like permease